VITLRFPTAQWFDPVGACCSCGRRASGMLMSHRNEKIGPMCQPCAGKAIAAAIKEREKKK